MLKGFNFEEQISKYNDEFDAFATKLLQLAFGLFNCDYQIWGFLQGNVWTSGEAWWVCSHLWNGVAYYHQLLHSLAHTYQLESRLADLLPYPNNG